MGFWGLFDSDLVAQEEAAKEIDFDLEEDDAAEEDDFGEDDDDEEGVDDDSEEGDEDDDDEEEEEPDEEDGEANGFESSPVSESSSWFY